MQRKPKLIKALADPMVSPDGSELWVRVEAHKSLPLDLAVPFSRLGEMIQFLAGCADFAITTSASTASQMTLGQAYQWAPIPIRAIGLGPGRSAAESMLVVQLAGCQLAFPISNDDLTSLADDFARNARLLSADPRKPQ